MSRDTNSQIEVTVQTVASNEQNVNRQFEMLKSLFSENESEDLPVFVQKIKDLIKKKLTLDIGFRLHQAEIVESF